MQIKRYEFKSTSCSCDCNLIECDDGDLVGYEEHITTIKALANELSARTAQAASDKETIRQLEEQVKKLAVENVWQHIKYRDFDALMRFNETREDGEAYVCDEAMSRLIALGLANKSTRGGRSITNLGMWVIDARGGVM